MRHDSIFNMNNEVLPLISIVVPCYNEESSLPLFYESFCEISKTMLSTARFELVLIDDGSRDATMKAIRLLASDDERVRYISFSRNFGKEPAMLAGFKKCTGDYIAIMDADLQDPVEMLVDMLKGIQEEGYDCVAARRVTREGEPFIRSLCAKSFYKIINIISTIPIVDGARDFRLMTRQMLNAIIAMPEYNRFSKGIFSFVGFKTKWLAYHNIQRAAGDTSWSFWGLFKYSIDGMLSFTTAPLQLASLLGLATCMLSFLYICFMVLSTLIWDNDVSGYPSLVCIIGFLGGCQLLTVGILGQYIAKLYLEVKARPIYIVKEEK